LSSKSSEWQSTWLQRGMGRGSKNKIKWRNFKLEAGSTSEEKQLPVEDDTHPFLKIISNIKTKEHRILKPRSQRKSDKYSFCKRKKSLGTSLTVCSQNFCSHRTTDLKTNINSTESGSWFQNKRSDNFLHLNMGSVQYETYQSPYNYPNMSEVKESSNYDYNQLVVDKYGCTVLKSSLEQQQSKPYQGEVYQQTTPPESMPPYSSTAGVQYVYHSTAYPDNIVPIENTQVCDVTTTNKSEEITYPLVNDTQYYPVAQPDTSQLSQLPQGPFLYSPVSEYPSPIPQASGQYVQYVPCFYYYPVPVPSESKTVENSQSSSIDITCSSCHKSPSLELMSQVSSSSTISCDSCQSRERVLKRKKRKKKERTETDPSQEVFSQEDVDSGYLNGGESSSSNLSELDSSPSAESTEDLFSTEETNKSPQKEEDVSLENEYCENNNEEAREELVEVTELLISHIENPQDVEIQFGEVQEILNDLTKDKSSKLEKSLQVTQSNITEKSDKECDNTLIENKKKEKIIVPLENEIYVDKDKLEAVESCDPVTVPLENEIYVDKEKLEAVESCDKMKSYVDILRNGPTEHRSQKSHKETVMTQKTEVIKETTNDRSNKNTFTISIAKKQKTSKKKEKKVTKMNKTIEESSQYSEIQDSLDQVELQKAIEESYKWTEVKSNNKKKTIVKKTTNISPVFDQETEEEQKQENIVKEEKIPTSSHVKPLSEMKPLFFEEKSVEIIEKSTLISSDSHITKKSKKKKSKKVDTNLQVSKMNLKNPMIFPEDIPDMKVEELADPEGNPILFFRPFPYEGSIGNADDLQVNERELEKSFGPSKHQSNSEKKVVPLRTIIPSAPHHSSMLRCLDLGLKFPANLDKKILDEEDCPSQPLLPMEQIWLQKMLTPGCQSSSGGSSRCCKAGLLPSNNLTAAAERKVILVRDSNTVQRERHSSALKKETTVKNPEVPGPRLKYTPGCRTGQLGISRKVVPPKSIIHRLTVL